MVSIFTKITLIIKGIGIILQILIKFLFFEYHFAGDIVTIGFFYTLVEN
jgi:hypothetical protein